MLFITVVAKEVAVTGVEGVSVVLRLVEIPTVLVGLRVEGVIVVLSGIVVLVVGNRDV